MTYVPPCADPSNDPDDWFIGKDGRQYADGPIPGYGSAEVQATWDEEEDRLGRALTEDEKRKIDSRLLADATREQIRRRRHAKDACHLRCRARLACLDIALSEGHRDGTWGGYTEEELRAIRLEIDRRKR